MKPDELQAQIKKRRIAPVYFLSGEDEYSREEAVSCIVDAVVDPSDQAFSLDLLNGESTDASTVLTLSATVPMLTEKRVVVVRSFQRLPQKDRESVISYAENPSKTTCLILTTPKVDLKTKLYARLNAAAESVVFYPLNPDRDSGRILAWLRRRAEGKNKRLSGNAADSLMEHIGGDLGDLAREMEKLTVYVGTRESIDASDVEAVMGASRTGTVFDLAEAIGRKDLAGAYLSLDRALSAGEPPQALIAILVRHMTILWKIRLMKRDKRSDDDVKKALRLGWGFNRNFGKYVSQSRLLSRKDLTGGFEALLQADLSLKTSTHTPQLIMQRMLYEMCTLNQS